MAEGHTIQIWIPMRWHMFLPFSGKGDSIDDDDIIDTLQIGHPDVDDAQHDDIFLQDTDKKTAQ